MCGIFGGIGTKISSGTIRALAIVNRERGTDSLGFFSSTGKMSKMAGDPLQCLGQAEISNYVDRACRKAWFLAGHTRLATHGKVIARNAHPFRFGRVIGAHNGVVSYPKEGGYQVDSEYLFDSLNKADGDYQAALEKVSGYWGLSWFDGGAFYLQAHKNTIALGCDARGTWYYSSDPEHLAACVSLTREYMELMNGDTVRFTENGGIEHCAAFKSKAVVVNTLAKYNTSKRNKRKYSEEVALYAKETGLKYDEARDCWADPFMRDARADYMSDWEKYTREYE
jgi:hypothetical protein